MTNRNEYKQAFQNIPEFQEMLSQFPFDAENDYVIAIEYDGCQLTEFIGVATNWTNAKKVLKIAYKRIKGRNKKYSPCLLQNCRHISFCI